jgi:hypothetical protein
MQRCNARPATGGTRSAELSAFAPAACPAAQMCGMLQRQPYWWGMLVSGESRSMEKPIDAGSKCTGRCSINPDAHKPSPLVASLLVCRFCGQITKKGEPLPGSLPLGQKKPQ